MIGWFKHFFHKETWREKQDRERQKELNKAYKIQRRISKKRARVIVIPTEFEDVAPWSNL